MAAADYSSSASYSLCFFLLNLLMFSSPAIAHPFQFPAFPPLYLPFPWTIQIPSKPLPAFDNAPHFPILHNLFLLLKTTACFNCTYFVSIDTPLAFTTPLSTSNLHLLHYQVVPFNLPLKCLISLPLAFRIPSVVNGSYVLVTSEQDMKMHSSLLTINYQLLVGGDLFVSDYMVVHDTAYRPHGPASKARPSHMIEYSDDKHLSSMKADLYGPSAQVKTYNQEHLVDCKTVCVQLDQVAFLFKTECRSSYSNGEPGCSHDPPGAKAQSRRAASFPIAYYCGCVRAIGMTRIYATGAVP